MADQTTVFGDFQKIAEILIDIRNRVDSDTDVVWTRFNDPRELIEDLTTDIQKLQMCDSETLSKVFMKFRPTSTYQELSISNGCGDEYLQLSKKFDYYRERIRAIFPAT